MIKIKVLIATIAMTRKVIGMEGNKMMKANC